MNSSTGPGDPPSLVYVVDDETAVAEMFAQILDLGGYRTRVFSEPDLALSEFETTPERPRLLLTDFGMKPFDGVELIERCREVEPGLKVILCSGFASEEVFRQSPGKDLFLKKPVRPGALLEAAGKLLREGDPS